MLELKDIRWDLPGGEALIKGIDLIVEPGKLTVITGPNGGGKTTLAKLISGLYEPTGGRILLNGEDITHWNITDRAKAGIAYAFQQPVRFKGLTVSKLLNLAAGRTMKEMEKCLLLEKVGLCAKEYIHRPIDTHLSGGESKRIEIASVLARDAKVLVFDEPEAGIDLWSFASLIDTFEKLKKEQEGALLIISHQERILSIADTIAVVSGGKISMCGPREDIYPKLQIGSERRCNCPLGKEVS